MHYISRWFALGGLGLSHVYMGKGYSMVKIMKHGCKGESNEPLFENVMSELGSRYPKPRDTRTS